MKKFALVMGARPNFIKAAPFLKEAKKHPEFSFTIIHTGQHFDDNMSKIFFEEMQIPKPHIHLDNKGELYTEKIGNMISSLDRVFKENNFDAAIVLGDVNSTLAGALAAVNNSCPLIHIEAGLRSYDRRMPEEINRAIIDHISSLLFTTEPEAQTNLIREGVDENKIKYVGNLMIESIELFRDRIMESDILGQLSLGAKEYAVATIHRIENTSSDILMKNILEFLNKINEEIPIIFPLHPSTRAHIEEFELGHLLKRLKIIEPIGYFDFMRLIIGSKGVITDSGGIQEETSHLGLPCCTLRDNTERPITLTMGSNKLFPLAKLDVDSAKKHLKRDDFKSGHIPLWDTKVSQRIFEHLN